MTTTARRTLAAAIALTLALGGALLGGSAANAATTPPVVVAGAPDSASSFVEYNGLLYLAGVAEGDIYTSLFSFDGTTFTHIANSPGGIGQMYVYDGQLIIEAEDDITSPPFTYVMFSYDGTSFTQVAAPFESPNGFTEAGGLLFFVATVAGTQELWQYDGTTASQVLTSGIEIDGNRFSEFNGVLYFPGTALPNAPKLYSYDPANPATPAAVPGSPDDPDVLVAYNGTEYLDADGSLYTFDGTTFALVPTPVEPYALTPFDGALYFTGYDGTNYSTYALRDGVTTAVPGLLTETPYYYEYNGSLYYGGFDGTIVSLASITAGVASLVAGGPSYPGDFIAYKGTLYFNSNGDGLQMYQLTSVAALANTGVDPRMPALLALVLLGLGAAVVVRARASRA